MFRASRPCAAAIHVSVASATTTFVEPLLLKCQKNRQNAKLFMPLTPPTAASLASERQAIDELLIKSNYLQYAAPKAAVLYVFY